MPYWSSILTISITKNNLSVFFFIFRTQNNHNNVLPIKYSFIFEINQNTHLLIKIRMVFIQKQ